MAKRMKIDLCVSDGIVAHYRAIKCTFQRCIDYVDILWRSAAARVCRTREVWEK